MAREPDPEIVERASRVRWVLLDVDGVLTDGRLFMGSNDFEGRSFHVRDGHAVRIGQLAGLRFGIVSGRESEVVTRRATELSIQEVHQGIHDKLSCVDEIATRHDLSHDVIAYIGDDLVDVPVMRRVGLAAAPSDAAAEAREAAHYVTEVGGGRGAVREVVDLVLRATGKFEQVTERFFK